MAQKSRNRDFRENLKTEKLGKGGLKTYLSPHKAGEICKHNNHRSLRICHGNQMIIMKPEMFFLPHKKEKPAFFNSFGSKSSVCVTDFSFSTNARPTLNTLQSSTDENDFSFPCFRAMLFNMAEVYDLS